MVKCLLIPLFILFHAFSSYALPASSSIASLTNKKNVVLKVSENEFSEDDVIEYISHNLMSEDQLVDVFRKSQSYSDYQKNLKVIARRDFWKAALQRLSYFALIEKEASYWEKVENKTFFTIPDELVEANILKKEQQLAQQFSIPLGKYDRHLDLAQKLMDMGYPHGDHQPLYLFFADWQNDQRLRIRHQIREQLVSLYEMKYIVAAKLNDVSEKEISSRYSEIEAKLSTYRKGAIVPYEQFLKDVNQLNATKLIDKMERVNISQSPLALYEKEVRNISPLLHEKLKNFIDSTLFSLLNSKIADAAQNQNSLEALQADFEQAMLNFNQTNNIKQLIRAKELQLSYQIKLNGIVPSTESTNRLLFFILKNVLNNLAQDSFIKHSAIVQTNTLMKSFSLLYDQIHRSKGAQFGKEENLISELTKLLLQEQIQLFSVSLAEKITIDLLPLSVSSPVIVEQLLVAKKKQILRDFVAFRLRNYQEMIEVQTDERILKKAEAYNFLLF